MGHKIVSALSRSARVGTLCLLVASVGCGGGGAAGPGGDSALGSGVLVRNNALTYGGHANPHAVTSLSYTRGGQLATVPVGLAPGDHAFVPLEPGGYTLAVTFDDGTTERLQVPSDQVTLFTGEVVTVLFLHA